MDSNKIAIFTIVNNPVVFDGFKTNLESQKNIIYQLIPIMNCNGEYNSARKAFNENATIDDVNYYVFSHPDIRFIDENSLSEIIEMVEHICSFGVVGVAGARRDGNKREIISTIVQGDNKETVGTQVKAPTIVQTVDECLFIIKRDDFQNHHFSDKEGWHLYGVEYCLDAILNGQQNYVVPSRVWHMSPGSSLDEKYMMQLEMLIKQYKSEFDMICTTVKAWPTIGLNAYLYRKYYWIKQRVKRMLVRR